ncbi:MAG: SPOR domain-containing protein [Treponema sp.]|nr:SPOR domain-containing protein [Treponema sp.]
MEQKRTLWIMAAVGVFLLVVLGAALILYSPTARSSQTIATVSPSNKQTSNGWVSLAPAENETTIPQTKMPATEVLSEQTNEVPQQNVINSEEKITRVAELTVYADKATIISNNPNEMNNVVAAVSSSVPEQETAEQTQTHHTVINNTTTIDINPVISEKPVVTPKNELTKNVIAKNSNKVTEKPVVKQVAKKEVSKPVSKPKKVTSTKATTSTTATAKVTKTPAKPKVVQYWVQVTSLKSKKSAENAREVLDENKITADIFTYKDKKDQLFYRVRVGPYTTKSEAEYWQSKIAKIDTFASSSSYITSTTLD